MNRNSNMIIKIGAIAFVIIGLFTVARLEMKYNEIESTRQALEQQYLHNQEIIEELERDLDAEFNEEYIKKIAREQLNLCMPEEVIFYNDINN